MNNTFPSATGELRRAEALPTTQCISFFGGRALPARTSVNNAAPFDATR